jgi:hypothetical protein
MYNKQEKAIINRINFNSYRQDIKYHFSIYLLFEEFIQDIFNRRGILFERQLHRQNDYFYAAYKNKRDKKDYNEHYITMCFIELELKLIEHVNFIENLYKEDYIIFMHSDYYHDSKELDKLQNNSGSNGNLVNLTENIQIDHFKNFFKKEGKEIIETDALALFKKKSEYKIISTPKLLELIENNYRTPEEKRNHTQNIISIAGITVAIIIGLVSCMTG